MKTRPGLSRAELGKNNNGQTSRSTSRGKDRGKPSEGMGGRLSVEVIRGPQGAVKKLPEDTAPGLPLPYRGLRLRGGEKKGPVLSKEGGGVFRTGDGPGR